jgi:nucleoid-associated protein YgaU
MNIEIQQPQPFDLVGDTILIAGNAVGFESHLSVEVTEGHDSVSGTATAGSTSIRQFQASVDIPPDNLFKLDRLFVIVSDDSAGGEGGIPSATVSVLYGPRILPGYTGYWKHTVESGQTLSAISTQYYGNAGQVSVIQRANPQVIDNPDVIFPGQVLRIPRND